MNKILITELEKEFIGRRVSHALKRACLAQHSLIEIIETAYIQGMSDTVECLKEENIVIKI